MILLMLKTNDCLRSVSNALVLLCYYLFSAVTLENLIIVR